MPKPTPTSPGIVGSSADSEARPVLYGGRLVAIVSPDRCRIFSADLDPTSLRFVAAMCCYNGEVQAGRALGPFTSERAERWARALLVPAERLTGRDSDGELAAELDVPVEQVAAARRDDTGGMARVNRRR